MNTNLAQQSTFVTLSSTPSLPNAENLSQLPLGIMVKSTDMNFPDRAVINTENPLPVIFGGLGTDSVSNFLFGNGSLPVTGKVFVSQFVQLSGSGTYVPPANLIFAVVFVQAPGGGGGGSQGSGQYSAGASSGGVSVSTMQPSDFGSGVAYSCGTFGTGASNLGNGTNGSVATFGSISANGGIGSNSSSVAIPLPPAPPAAGAGTIAVGGKAGNIWNGGNSWFGGGGLAGLYGSNYSGAAGLGYGSGGSGTGGGTGLVGGNGAPGTIILFLVLAT